MNIAVIGTGYVGLVTGTCLAEMGNNVVCVDTNVKKVKNLRCGVVPIYEPRLNDIFNKNIKAGRLKFTTKLKDVVDDASVIFLALPTPPNKDGSADISCIMDVSIDIGKIIKEYKIIVNKSTAPVGTSEKIRDAISKNSGCAFDVVSNPEFLREGFAVDDFMKSDRVVIGCSAEKSKCVMKEIFDPFVRQGNPIYFMDERSAELTKYVANSFLAMKISYMNEIANLCELIGANVDDVRIGVGSDNRIGKRFLFPGIGYGGSCFPKDVLALTKISNQNNHSLRILESVIKVNNIQKRILVEKIRKHFNGDISGKKVAIWGLSFKPNTDDVRESSSHEIIRELLDEKMIITSFDPQAIENTKNIFGQSISYTTNMYDALIGVDFLVIATEWSEFRSPDFYKISSLMKNKIIFDGRNIYDTELMNKLGFYYYSIGRKSIKPLNE